MVINEKINEQIIDMKLSIEIFRLSKIIRRPITYTVIQTILVNMVVDGNPLPCFLDQRLKKPTTSFANACVMEPTSNT